MNSIFVYKDLENTEKYLKDKLAGFSENLDALEKSICALINSGTFSGAGADSVIYYFNNVYGIIIPIAKRLIDNLYKEYVLYVNDYASHNFAGDTQFKVSELKELTKMLKKSITPIDNVDADTWDMLKRPPQGSGLSFSRPPISPIHSQRDKVLLSIKNLQEAYQEIESGHANIESIQDDITKAKAFVKCRQKKSRVPIADFDIKNYSEQYSDLLNAYNNQHLIAFNNKKAYQEIELYANDIDKIFKIETYQGEEISHYSPCGFDPFANTLAWDEDFGERTNPVTGEKGSFHAGIDINWNNSGDLASKDAQVQAADSGTVIFAGPLGNYGNCVKIDHGNGIVTLYAHMQNGSLNVKEGDKIKAGYQIGKVGSTGRSTGAHLHFEVQKNGEAVDPVPYLQEKKTVSKTKGKTEAVTKLQPTEFKISEKTGKITYKNNSTKTPSEKPTNNNGSTADTVREARDETRKIKEQRNESTTYTVKKGDTLWDIGQEHGVDYHKIAEDNNIENPSLIHPGETFTINKK